MLKDLNDKFEHQNKEKLDQHFEVKKRIQKQNEKLIKQIKKQFKDHVVAIKEKDEHKGLVV